MPCRAASVLRTIDTNDLCRTEAVSKRKEDKVGQHTYLQQARRVLLEPVCRWNSMSARWHMGCTAIER